MLFKFNSTPYMKFFETSLEKTHFLILLIVTNSCFTFMRFQYLCCRAFRFKKMKKFRKIMQFFDINRIWLQEYAEKVIHYAYAVQL
jgi:hypothetical protein